VKTGQGLPQLKLVVLGAGLAVSNLGRCLVSWSRLEFLLAW
jgi:hypothetical protein